MTGWRRSACHARDGSAPGRWRRLIVLPLVGPCCPSEPRVCRTRTRAFAEAAERRGFTLAAPGRVPRGARLGMCARRGSARRRASCPRVTVEEIRAAEIDALRQWFPAGARVLRSVVHEPIRPGRSRLVTRVWSRSTCPGGTLAGLLVFPVRDYDGAHIPFADCSFDILSSPRTSSSTFPHPRPARRDAPRTQTRRPGRPCDGEPDVAALDHPRSLRGRLPRVGRTSRPPGPSAIGRERSPGHAADRHTARPVGGLAGAARRRALGTLSAPTRFGGPARRRVSTSGGILDARGSAPRPVLYERGAVP
jgi:hypothetical protein